jgi:hypothetical protein
MLIRVLFAYDRPHTANGKVDGSYPLSVREWTATANNYKPTGNRILEHVSTLVSRLSPQY